MLPLNSLEIITTDYIFIFIYRTSICTFFFVISIYKICYHCRAYRTCTYFSWHVSSYKKEEKSYHNNNQYIPPIIMVSSPELYADYLSYLLISPNSSYIFILFLKAVIHRPFEMLLKSSWYKNLHLKALLDVQVSGTCDLRLIIHYESIHHSLYCIKLPL